jgi:basic membrane protein A
VILTSVMKNMDNSVFDVIKAAKNGKFEGCSNYVGDLKNGGVGIASYHDLDSKVPTDLKKEVDDLKKKIVNGDIKDTGCLSFPDYCPGGLYK